MAGRFGAGRNKRDVDIAERNVSGLGYGKGRAVDTYCATGGTLGRQEFQILMLRISLFY